MPVLIGFILLLIACFLFIIWCLVNSKPHGAFLVSSVILLLFSVSCAVTIPIAEDELMTQNELFIESWSATYADYRVALGRFENKVDARPIDLKDYEDWMNGLEFELTELRKAGNVARSHWQSPTFKQYKTKMVEAIDWWESAANLEVSLHRDNLDVQDAIDTALQNGNIAHQEALDLYIIALDEMHSKEPK